MEATVQGKRSRVIPVETEKENRCPDCHRLLFKGRLAPGSRIEVKCPREGCKQMVTIASM